MIANLLVKGRIVHLIGAGRSVHLVVTENIVNLLFTVMLTMIVAGVKKALISAHEVLLLTILCCSWVDIPFCFLHGETRIVFLSGCLGMGYPQK
jgi:hypothetical protein